MEDFKLQVKKGFQGCKADIQELQEENQVLKQEIQELRNEIKGLTIAIEHIKQLQVAVVQQPTPQVQEQPVVKDKAPKVEKDPYEALLEFKAKSNKRELLKQKMLSMVGEHGMNLSELRFMFVEHFRYTSKATFYNYLKELEIEKLVRVERENSKNYIYLTTALKKEV